MILFNNLQSLLKNENFNGTQSVKLKAGEMFNGQVIKFFADNLALVQLGGIKLHAKLDAPLMTDVKYWFQVVPNDSMVELKLIDNPALVKSESSKVGEDVSKASIAQLLKQFGLSNTKENQPLMKLFVNGNLPFTKETLKEASNWLKEVKPELTKGLDAIKVSLQRGLPITKNVLNSMLALQTNESLSANLVKVQDAISTLDHKSPTMQQLHSTLNQLTNQTEKDIFIKTFYQTLKYYFQTTELSEQKIAQSLLSKMGIHFNELEQIRNTISNGVSQMANQISLNPTLSNDLSELAKNNRLTTAEFFSSLFKIMDQKEMDLQNQVIKLLVEAFNPKKDHVNNLSLADDELFKKIQQSLNESQVKWDIGTDVLKTLKQLVNNLGLHYERDLNILENEQSINEKLQSLKPLLLKALEEQLSPNIREKIDHLLQRITGQQLITSEQQGSIQQLIMQIPLLLGNQLTDLTMQWSGKKQKNGQIDPNYCRILFYLELEQLQETLVDVHVQNRIVNIQIYNETLQLNTIVKNFQPLLKNQLETLNYHLSSVSVASRKDSLVTMYHNQTGQFINGFNSSINGVDVRV